MAEEAWVPECGICFTPFGPDAGAVPRVLVSCGHTLCESCISRLALRWPLASPEAHALAPAAHATTGRDTPGSSAGLGAGGSVTVRCSECGVTSLSPASLPGSRGALALALGFPRNIELLRVIDALARLRGPAPAFRRSTGAVTRGEADNGASRGAFAGIGAGVQQGVVADGATVTLPRVPTAPGVRMAAEAPRSESPGPGTVGGRESEAPGLPARGSREAGVVNPEDSSRRGDTGEPAREVREGEVAEPAGRRKEGGIGESPGGAREEGVGEQVALVESGVGPWVCHRDVISAALVLGLGGGGKGEPLRALVLLGREWLVFWYLVAQSVTWYDHTQ